MFTKAMVAGKVLRFATCYPVIIQAMPTAKQLLFSHLGRHDVGGDKQSNK